MLQNMQDRREVRYDSIKSAGNYSNRACCAFFLTLVIYFFNLDMKFAASLIKPLTAYYNWSKNRREAKKHKQEEQKE